MTGAGAGCAVRYDSPIPPYQQIAAEVVRDIESGAPAVDRPVPSESALIQRWGVARDTARRAVRHLRDQGYVYTVPQRGTYVRERSSEADES
ncbi:winged helix-turn-helix domain-containing protein [Streptomyces sp. SID12501]|uniref:Winged helix-turn-helix transcriptional regulator n=1 Tax=Streptomyces sp. SID12501 TaxID=2706042 RepID=A0A6B3C4R3_9ACTN|nr:winged helix-turn-helix domain-containing protein [Streptomyces sp. SID12501]NEC91396.1 winged helix-turn-helix transcriptional regulator [Streptomyces sp. SID12501]